MPETSQPVGSSESPNGAMTASAIFPEERQSDSSNLPANSTSVHFPDERHPIEVLADEYAAKLRSGEMPSIEDYERRAPEHEAEIRSLFPTIAIIERMTHRHREHVKSRVGEHPIRGRENIGEFQLIREIGRGGMGIVYEAIQSSLARRVALKVLGAAIANSPLQLQRFRREAESAARLHHTNIVPVYNIGEEDGIHFYAMQFIDGIPLANAIETVRHRSSVTRQPSERDGSRPVRQSGSAHVSSPEHGPDRPPNSAIDDPTTLMTINQDCELVVQAAQPSKDPGPKAPFAVHGARSPIDHVSRVLPIVGSSEGRAGLEESASADSRGESVDACFGFFANNTTPDYFRRIAKLTAQVADALEYAHQHGVLHRDIKPSNLMLDRDGGVWIMDFGLVKIIEQRDLTQAGEIVGTLRYMAPEQFEGQADVRTDIYALGLTLFELLTLVPAFDGDNQMTLSQRLRQSDIPKPRSINSSIPRDLETIVLKATSREPFARYASAAMLSEDLRRFCDDRPILARRTTYIERLWRWSRRNPELATATSSTIVLLGIVAVVASLGWMKVNSALRDADRARGRAESNLDSAINAFDSILENVTSRGLPTSLSLEVADASFEPARGATSEDDARLLNQLLEFYRKFANENAENTGLRTRTASAYRRAGGILVRLGRLSEACEDFQTAIELLARILKTDPNNVDAVVQSASIYNEIGELYLRRGEFDETFLAHLQARALLLELPPQAAMDRSVRFELARSTDLFASIDIRSGTDESPAAPPNRRSRKPPTEGSDRSGFRPPPFDSAKISSRQNRPFPPHDHGQNSPDDLPGPPPTTLNERLRNALPAPFFASVTPGDPLAAALLDASEEFRSLVKEFPEVADYKFRLAQSLRHRLVHAAGQGNSDVAALVFREAIEILGRLRTEFPEDPKFLYELVKTLTQASRAESKDQAKESLELAVSNAEHLAELFPAASDYQLLLGKALARRAASEADAHEMNDAKISLDKSIETLERLANQFPDQGIIQIPLAKTRQQFGDLLRTVADDDEIPAEREGRLEESYAQLKKAIEGFETYLSRSQIELKPHRKGHFNSETRRNLYVSLAETLDRLQRPEEAEKIRLKITSRRGPPPPKTSP